MNQNKVTLLIVPIILAAAVWYMYPFFIHTTMEPSAIVSREYAEALTLIQKGKLEEARKKLEAGQLKEPNEGKYHFAMGNIFRMQSNLDEALIQYEQAVQKSPQLKEAYNNIAAIDMLHNKLDKALEAVTNGLKQDAEYKDLLFKKGQLLYLKGDYVQAVEILQPLTRDMEYVEAYRFIGLAYASQHDRAHALQFLQSYLQKTPKGTEGRAELDKLVEEMRK